MIVYSTQHMQTGGIESHLQEFCKQLASSGIELDLVILKSVMLPETEAFYRKNCRKVYLGKKDSRVLQIFWLFFIRLKFLFKPSIVLYTNGQGNSVGFFAKLLQPKIWVHHHHTSGDAEDQAGWSNWYINTLKKADKLIACSSSNANHISNFLKREVEAIPCFSKKVVITNQTRTSSRLKFGYYGRLLPEKGIDTICKLSEDPELNFIEFHIWGKGDTYSADYFNKFNNVYYHGVYNGQEELSKVIEVLDAYLLISTHGEGLPISLLEAMSAGLPWIATGRGGIPDIACDPYATKVISATPNYNEIKNAVEILAQDIYAGRVSKTKQMELYNMQFSSHVLISRWCEAFGIK